MIELIHRAPKNLLILVGIYLFLLLYLGVKNSKSKYPNQKEFSAYVENQLNQFERQVKNDEILKKMKI